MFKIATCTPLNLAERYPRTVIALTIAVIAITVISAYAQRIVTAGYVLRLW